MRLDLKDWHHKFEPVLSDAFPNNAAPASAGLKECILYKEYWKFVPPTLGFPSP